MLRIASWAVLTLMVATLTVGCASRGRVPPPVEDRKLVGSTLDKPQPGSENAGKPGYYTVKSGDTLIRIGMDHGQSWRDIVRWNNLDNPNVIETGQVLRVAPPAQESGVVVRPITSSAAQATPVTESAPAQAAVAQPAPPAPATAQPASPAPSADTAEEAIRFQWPAKGHTLTGFDEAKNKGIDIAGKAGDPVFASADGKVVYAGSGLRGYGNLIIVKHNNTYLTAYAHNQALLVKEDQVVKRGQKIAEMGNSDADQVKLHFEVRRQGKPVDPMRYLLAN